MRAEHRYNLRDLLRVMERLRDPEHGCPWDQAQDFRSIVPSTLEESYELAAAIEQENYPHVAEELGDVLFQVVFYAQLGREQGRFDFPQIVSTLVDKLLRRHPHVFESGEIEGVVEQRTGVEEVKHSWETIKKQERREKRQTGILADIPTALPALSRAQKMQKRASQSGFDWEDIDGVLAKVEEELGEFVDAQTEGEARREDELGDLLFSCVNLARHAGVDAEAALRRATSKFERRFQRVEKSLQDRGEEMQDLDAGALDEEWRRAKRAD